MKMNRLIPWAFVCVFSAISSHAATRIKADLVKIADGDTVTVRDEKSKYIKVRMLGLDTPELHFEKQAQEPWASQSTTHLHEMVNGTEATVNAGGRITKAIEDRTSGKPVEVEVEISGVDKYKRALGYVIYKGTNTNLQMVKDGWAYPYLYCDKTVCNKDWHKDAMAKEFVEACEQATKDKTGLFAVENPLTETPWEFRRRIRKDKPYQYIGDFHTKKLYAPADGGKVSACASIRFESETDALALGYDY